ncbi:MAG TPA: hypothetical protein VMD74_00975 [Candidatus Methylomirabilis sp.]|nr:hypothetical protein [Candidatus Methylomirabilis sp.]
MNFWKKNFFCQAKENPGQILLEVLVAMSIAAVVMVLGSQLIYVSLLGNKISLENNVASGLLEETFAAVAASATENWSNVYSLNHGAAPYSVRASGGKWSIAVGAENLPLNAAVYARSFVVQNVCRNISTRAIAGTSDSGGSATTCENIPGSGFDPSTQKITATVSWAGAASLTGSYYLTRWRNKTCLQSAWSGINGNVQTCPTDFYDSLINITPGASLKLCSGGC